MNQSFSILSNPQDSPAIAVLIPHFNNLEGLKKTLSSLSYDGKMHVVIVDDGSSLKPSPENLQFIGTENCLLHLVYLEKNLGIEKALNKGIEFIANKLEVKYIARIDSGDLQLSNRLEKQVAFLEENQKVGILGTAAKFVSNDGLEHFKIRYPGKNTQIKKQMGLRCSILHPTVMFRASILGKSSFYPSKYPYADDYAFFYSLLGRTKAANLKEILTQVEYCESSASIKNRKHQLKSRIRIIYDNFHSSPFSTFGILYTAIMLILPNHLIVSLKSRIS